MASPTELAQLLVGALREPSRRQALVKEFIHRFNREPLTDGDTEMSDVLDGIMTLLTLYEPDPRMRDDPLFYGDQRLVGVLRQGIEELRQRGVSVPSE